MEVLVGQELEVLPTQQRLSILVTLVKAGVVVMVVTDIVVAVEVMVVMEILGRMGVMVALGSLGNKIPTPQA